MKIGELAKRSGLTAHTIRYYERIGLLPYADRNQSRQRDYDASILTWIEFLGRLKTTGMPIRDMLRYAALRERGVGTEAERRDLLERHRDGRPCPRCRTASVPSRSRHQDCRLRRHEQGGRIMTQPRKHSSTGMRTPSTGLLAAESRLERGQRALDEIDGKAGHNVIAALADIAPDFATYVIEFPFGDIYSPSRPRSAGPRDRDHRRPDRARQCQPAAQGAHRGRPERRSEPRRDHRGDHADGGLCRLPGRAQRSVRGQGNIRPPRHAQRGDNRLLIGNRRTNQILAVTGDGKARPLSPRRQAARIPRGALIMPTCRVEIALSSGRRIGTA